MPFDSDCFVPIAVYLRRHLPETLHGAGRRRITRAPGCPASPAHPGAFHPPDSRGTVSTYVGNFMTTFAIATLKMPPLAAMTATVVEERRRFPAPLLGMALRPFRTPPTMLWPRILLAPRHACPHSTRSSPIPHRRCSVATLLQTALTAPQRVGLPRCHSGVPPARIPGHRSFPGVFGRSHRLRRHHPFIVTWMIDATGNPAAPRLVCRGNQRAVRGRP